MAYITKKSKKPEMLGDVGFKLDKKPEYIKKKEKKKEWITKKKEKKVEYIKKKDKKKFNPEAWLWKSHMPHFEKGGFKENAFQGSKEEKKKEWITKKKYPIIGKDY